MPCNCLAMSKYSPVLLACPCCCYSQTILRLFVNIEGRGEWAWGESGQQDIYIYVWWDTCHQDMFGGIQVIMICFGGGGI